MSSEEALSVREQLGQAGRGEGSALALLYSWESSAAKGHGNGLELLWKISFARTTSPFRLPSPHSAFSLAGSSLFLAESVLACPGASSSLWVLLYKWVSEKTAH